MAAKSYNPQLQWQNSDQQFLQGQESITATPIKFSPPGVQGIRNTDVASGPLDCLISEVEAENALLCLNNHQVCGPYRVAGKLWKYTAGAISTTLASVSNQVLQEWY